MDRSPQHTRISSPGGSTRLRAALWQTRGGGWFGAVRTSENATEVYRNGASGGTNSIASATPSNVNMKVGRVNTGSRPGEFSSTHFGGRLIQGRSLLSKRPCLPTCTRLGQHSLSWERSGAM